MQYSVVNEWPKETASSFAFESVCAKTMCEWFETMVAPAPFFGARGTIAREENFLFAQSVAEELSDIMSSRNASTSYCRASDTSKKSSVLLPETRRRRNARGFSQI